MTHHAVRLPEEVELGAVKSTDWGTEVVPTDDGHEVRNNRWSAPLRSFEISFPVSRRNGEIYLAVLDLYELVEGSRHSFNLVDWTDETGGTVVPVRFDSALSTTAVATHLEHIETLMLVEVRLAPEVGLVSGLRLSGDQLSNNGNLLLSGDEQTGNAILALEEQP